MSPKEPGAPSTLQGCKPLQQRGWHAIRAGQQPRSRLSDRIAAFASLVSSVSPPRRLKCRGLGTWHWMHWHSMNEKQLLLPAEVVCQVRRRSFIQQRGGILPLLRTNLVSPFCALSSSPQTEVPRGDLSSAWLGQAHLAPFLTAGSAPPPRMRLDSGRTWPSIPS